MSVILRVPNDPLLRTLGAGERRVHGITERTYVLRMYAAQLQPGETAEENGSAFLAYVAGLLGLSLCFALAFAWVSVWVGMTVRTSGAGQGVMFLLISPLSFGSNAFVQASTMPG
jgi:hypothetical protein